MLHALCSMLLWSHDSRFDSIYIPHSTIHNPHLERWMRFLEGEIKARIQLGPWDVSCFRTNVPLVVGVSINQFISSAVSEKISALMTEDYLEKRAKRAKKGDFKKILSKVPSRAPLHDDEL